MATTQIKSFDSDKQVKVTDNNELLITGNISTNNTSVGPTGDTAPSDATLAGGVDPLGNLTPLQVDADGALITSGFDGGFSTLSPGFPTQINVGLNSTQLFGNNPSRKYAHISNNSSESIFIQYLSSAALNQGIRIGPGGFYTLDVDNLWRGIVNAIGVMGNQLIDVVEGE